MKKAQILLSTYNGEKYIVSQLDSLLNQKEVDINIMVRDDGSNDNTINIIKNFKDERITIFEENNVGSTKSFMELIKISSNADYYAFCDQDDVWDSDKLISAISKIECYDNIPAIYSSNTKLVDSNLNFIKKEDKNPVTTLGSAIIKNYATGCTVVFNKKLMDLLKKSSDAEIPFHDWWANLVAIAVGGISVFDCSAHINYRQHENNVVGGSYSILKKWKNRLNRYKHNIYFRDKMASELLKYYSKEIDKGTYDTLSIIEHYKFNKLKIIFNKNIKTKKLADDLLFALCIINNKI